MRRVNAPSPVEHHRARVVELTAEMYPAASSMLGRAFEENPMHVAAFGAGQLGRNQAFFRIGLGSMRGMKLAAFEGPTLVGFVHWVASPGCRYSSLERLAFARRAVGALGLRCTSNVARWLASWARHDPHEPHVHFGPIGVDPTARGRSIGRLLMDRHCAAVDEGGLSSYLETDRPANIGFYERFGFEVIAEARALGVPTYFMWRKGRAASSP